MIEILAIDDDLDFHEILKIKLPAQEYNLTLTSSESDFFDKYKTFLHKNNKNTHEHQIDRSSIERHIL